MLTKLTFSKKGILSSVLFTGLMQLGYAQDIHLSQFFNTPLLRNPALAGIFTGDIRVQAVYRNQWQSIGFPYQTSAISGEYKFSVGHGDDYITTGLSFFYDVAGIMRLKTLQVMPALNFHKSLSGNKNSYLSAGFMAGIIQRQFDGKTLTFDNQYNNGRYDPSLSSGEGFTGMKRSFADFAAGLSYNSSLGQEGNYFIGASLWHFNKPKANFLANYIQLDPKMQFNGGIRTPLSDWISLQTEVNYLKQGNYNETVAGALILYSFNDQLVNNNDKISNVQLGAGMFVRLNDAIIPEVQISYNHFDIGLSYDINISKLNVASHGRGGYELSLSYRAFANPDMVSYMRCPRF